MLFKNLPHLGIYDHLGFNTFKTSISVPPFFFHTVCRNKISIYYLLSSPSQTLDITSVTYRDKVYLL